MQIYNSKQKWYIRLSTFTIVIIFSTCSLTTPSPKINTEKNIFWISLPDGRRVDYEPEDSLIDWISFLFLFTLIGKNFKPILLMISCFFSTEQLLSNSTTTDNHRKTFGKLWK
jgi:hypothetical protein